MSEVLSSGRRAEFLAGIRAELPILLGVTPFGMIYGALAMSAGLPPNAALAMSSILFAGSAQFVATQLFATGTPGLVIVLTAAVVNLRHMLYSASVAPHLRRLGPAWKGLLAYLLTDEAYAVGIIRYRRGSENGHGHWHLFGAGLALWATWQLSTAAGIFLGSQVPASWSLDFTLALTFIALVVPALEDRPDVVAALAAGGVALLAANWPYKTGLMAAALTGILAGLAATHWQALRARHRSARQTPTSATPSKRP